MENDDLAHKPLTFGSLFAGIGGFDLGLERAGMVCKWQVEIDEYASKVLAKHWPNVHRWDDVCTWPQENTEYVDVICGGFPCQDISYAGKGAGLDGERSGLWFEFARVVREMEPRAVAVENVAALLTRGLDEVLGTLASLGYDAEWDCIPAAAVGAPHIRDRIFILGYASGKRLPARRICDREYVGNESDAASENSKVLADTQGQRRRETREHCERQAKRPTDSRDVLAGSKSNRRRQRITDGRRSCEGTSPREERGLGDGDSFSSDTDSEVLASRDEPRVIREATRGTLAELERIRSKYRGFWDTEPAVGRVANGIPNRAHRLRGLGNAIVPQVAEVIGRRIVQKLNP